MAEGKKSFTAYCDWGLIFDEMTDEQAGKLVKHLFDYVRDKDPESEDIVTKVSFASIKATLKRDLVKWREKSEKNKENARRRWDKSESENMQTDANACERKKSDANDADSVSVSVKDSVNVTVIEKEKVKKKKSYRFSPPSVSEIYDYMIEKKLPDKVARSESEKMWNFYESKNWMVGKSKMSKWKSAVSGWIGRMKTFENGKSISNNEPTINRQSAETIRSNSIGWEID